LKSQSIKDKNLKYYLKFPKLDPECPLADHSQTLSVDFILYATVSNKD